ncbi:MAG: rhodanese-like domain-containing protein [Defluviitaleaceae bacterium]|nr:rhodanese-like domain-containing protein [Defluviitaleaceae bacterium]
MKYIRFLIVVLLVVAMTTGCNTVNPIVYSETPLSISSWDEAEYMAKNGEAIILDVRTTDEFNSGNALGAISLPLDELSSGIELIISDKNQIIFVYCRSGARSANAVVVLEAIGYQNVIDLGGIINR